jgi:hypothetical protein
LPELAYIRLKIWGSLLLAASMVSCSPPASQPVSGLSGPPPSIISPKSSVPPATSADTENIYSEEPFVSSTPASSLPVPATTPSTSVVEISNITPEPTEEVLPPETPFKLNSPSLAGIGFGASDKEVVKHYGLPMGTYPLPGDKQTVDIWEYAGFSIGLNKNNLVVYVEITSSNIDTGIKGLLSGMNGAQAAQILGVENDASTNVLATEVTGGWFKIDLDPETRQVLSLKLLSNEI